MIYLDNAATTLVKPPRVSEAVLVAMERLGNSGRGGHGAAMESARTLYKARKMLCDFFHADAPEQVAFTLNATYALNTAICGLLSKGDRVITTVAEHNSVLRPLYAKGVELTVIGCDEKGCVREEELLRAIVPGVRGVVVAHASNVTGNSVNLASIGARCREVDAFFIVDAAQSAGLLPIDMQRDKIDVLCFTGHKALYGMQGTGGLCVRKGVKIAPLCVGGSGVQTFSKEPPQEMPEALEAGTQNAHGIAALMAGMEYILDVGMNTLLGKETRLIALLRDALETLDGVTIYGDLDAPQRTGILSFAMRGVDSAVLADWLAQKFQIALRAGGHCAPLLHEALGTKETGLVRVSVSWQNTPTDMLKLAGALKRYMEEQGA